VNLGPAHAGKVGAVNSKGGPFRIVGRGAVVDIKLTKTDASAIHDSQGTSSMRRLFRKSFALAAVAIGSSGLRAPCDGREI
jgi:hypothetical protein